MAAALVLAPYAAGAIRAAATSWRVLAPVLRFGPTTFRALDTFRSPPQLGPATQDVGAKQRLRELVDDALAGARVGVASLPMPKFPGGPMFPLAPEASLGGLLLKQLLNLFNQQPQSWGNENARGVPTTANPAGNTYENSKAGQFKIEYFSFNESGAAFDCTSGSVLSGPSFQASDDVQTLSSLSKIEFFALEADTSTSCGSEWTDGTTIQYGWRTYLGDGTQYGGFYGGLSIGKTSPLFHKREQSGLRIKSMTIGNEPWEPFGTIRDPISNNKTTVGPTITAPAIPSPNQIIAPALVPVPNNTATSPQDVSGGSLPSVGAASVPSNPTSSWKQQVSGASSSSTSTSSAVGTLPSPIPQPLPLPAYTPPLVQPAPTQPMTQTQTSGALVPTTAPPVVATAPGAIVPWPGAAAIPATGVAPAATLQGIAREVGRIERKLEVMNTPNAPGNLVDKFDLVNDLKDFLVEGFLASMGGTTYTMDSPCEVDAEGVKLPPVQVPAGGALTNFGLVLNRLDALAELLQVHKNLKQPNCRQKPPTGEFVTVNFEEID